MTREKEKTKGPGKGNRTKGKDRRGGGGKGSDLSGLQQYAKDKKAAAEYYKEIARRRENSFKYTMPFFAGAIDRIGQYIDDQRGKHLPLTVAGMQLAADILPDSWGRILNGEYDSMLYEYMSIRDIPFADEGSIYHDETTGDDVYLLRPSDVLKKYLLFVQEERESKCSSLKGNPAGNIFLLKAQQGFQDTPTESKVTNNNLVIADREQAAKALALVMGSE